MFTLYKQFMRSPFMHLIKNFNLRLKAIKRRHFDRIWRLLTSSCCSALQPSPPQDKRRSCLCFGQPKANQQVPEEVILPTPIHFPWHLLPRLAWLSNSLHNLLEKGLRHEKKQGGCFRRWFCICSARDTAQPCCQHASHLQRSPSGPSYTELRSQTGRKEERKKINDKARVRSPTHATAPQTLVLPGHASRVKLRRAFGGRCAPWKKHGGPPSINANRKQCYQENSKMPFY